MLIFLILVLSLGLRLTGLNQSFWLDEAAQLIESTRPLSEQFKIAGDFQPPLFHVLLHFWLWFGKSEIWVRLLPLVLGLISIYLLYLIAQKLVNQRVALISSLLLAISPFHIWYSQEVRPYMLAVVLGSAATYFLLKRNWVKYTVAAILLIYSMYLTPFLVLTHGVYVWIWQREQFKRWLISLLVISLSFIPWIPSFWQQLGIGSSLRFTLPGWSEAVSTTIYKSLPLIFAKFTLGRITFANKWFYGGLVSGLFIFFGILFAGGYKKFKSEISQVGLLGVLPILLAFGAAFFLPILAPQRVLFSLPFFYVLWSIGLVSRPRLKQVGLTILIGVSLYSWYLYHSRPEFQREQWRQAVSYVENNRTAKSKVIFVFPDAFAPWQWYSHGLVENIAVAPTFTVKETELSQFTSSLVTSDRLFYFHYLTDLTDPSHRSENYLVNLGFFETQKIDFPGVGFISIYEKI